MYICIYIYIGIYTYIYIYTYISYINIYFIILYSIILYYVILYYVILFYIVFYYTSVGSVSSAVGFRGVQLVKFSELCEKPMFNFLARKIPNYRILNYRITEFRVLRARILTLVCAIIVEVLRRFVENANDPCKRSM